MSELGDSILAPITPAFLSECIPSCHDLTSLETRGQRQHHNTHKTKTSVETQFLLHDDIFNVDMYSQINLHILRAHQIFISSCISNKHFLIKKIVIVSLQKTLV